MPRRTIKASHSANQTSKQSVVTCSSRFCRRGRLSKKTLNLSISLALPSPHRIFLCRIKCSITRNKCPTRLANSGDWASRGGAPQRHLKEGNMPASLPELPTLKCVSVGKKNVARAFKTLRRVGKKLKNSSNLFVHSPASFDTAYCQPTQKAYPSSKLQDIVLPWPAFIYARTALAPNSRGGSEPTLNTSKTAITG